MITKEQAMTCQNFRQIKQYCNGRRKVKDNGTIVVFYNGLEDCKPINWRANGKCQTWKTRPDEFRLPIKHGLYDHSYITQDNAHLFEVSE